MNPSSIGQLIQRRRKTLGLSQIRLAKFCDVSRSTIRRWEAGMFNNPKSDKLNELLRLIDVKLDTTEKRAHHNALVIASRTASVSYREELSPEALAQAMVDGRLPSELTPHVATLLDEAPLQIIVGAVEEVSHITGCPATKIWTHLLQWAHKLQSPRAAWA